MFIKGARKRPWGSCPSTTWQDTKYFTKRNLTAGRSRCGLRRARANAGERLRQEGNWIFPGSKGEGCTRRRKVVREREGGTEIDLGLEINILNQQRGCHFAFSQFTFVESPHHSSCLGTAWRATRRSQELQRGAAGMSEFPGCWGSSGRRSRGSCLAPTLGNLHSCPWWSQPPTWLIILSQ